jgi:hypothetical protein
MSAEIVTAADGVLTIKITGKLTQPELQAVQKSAAEILTAQGKMRVLVIAQEFEGWEKTGDWGNISIQDEMDPKIKKMAIVGESKWEDLALLFAAKGLRKFPIEYFQPQDLAKARGWLMESTDGK